MKNWQSIKLVLIFCVFCFVAQVSASATEYDVNTPSLSLCDYSDTVGVTYISVYDDFGGNGQKVLIGESIHLVANLRPADATNRSVLWSTSNPSVAKVSNGVVTTYGKGTATITATSVDSNLKASYTVTVVDENSTYEYNGATYNYVFEKGTWGSNIKWYYCSGGKLVILGSGAMKEASHMAEIPWRNIDPLTIKIGEGITYICENAFHAMEANKVYIPSTVSEIGRWAFYYFTSSSNFLYWYYGGTLEQWNSMIVGDNNNFPSVPKEYCKATGHIEAVTPAVKPTCISYGKTLGVHCSQCDMVIVKSNQVPYTDCVYENGYCSVCGKADPTVYVTSVNIPVDEYRVHLNTSANINAVVLPENANNKKLIWTSSNPEIATVSTYGTVTGKTLGRVTITATSEDGGKSDTCVVTVIEPTVAVKGVLLNKTSLTMNVGAIGKLTATVSPSDATNKNVFWKSSNNSVVSVSNGVLIANAVGTATITVTTEDGSKVDTCTVTVIQPVEKVIIDKDVADLYVGDILTLTATVIPDNAINKALTWTSSDESVATVANGVVTALSSGNATITVASVEGNKTATCIIVVKTKVLPVAAQLSSAGNTTRPGKTVEIPIIISENTGIAGLELDITYADELELISVVNADAFENLDMMTSKDTTAKPYIVTWDGVDADTSNGTIAVITFRVKEETVAGEYDINIKVAMATDGNLDDVYVNDTSVKLTVKDYILGDTNNDGEINLKDAITLRRYIVGGYGVETTPAFDANNDGIINLKDVITIRRYIVGGYGVEL